MEAMRERLEGLNSEFFTKIITDVLKSEVAEYKQYFDRNFGELKKEIGDIKPPPRLPSNSVNIEI